MKQTAQQTRPLPNSVTGNFHRHCQMRVLCLAVLVPLLAAVASADLTATIRLEGTKVVFSLTNPDSHAIRVLYVLCAVLGWIM